MMQAGLIFLVLAYMLSQFYRSFLAVLAPSLTADLGLGPEALSTASGYWFLAFAAAQIPTGWALDRWGPRRVTAVQLGLAGGAGAALIAAAQGGGAVALGMALIGAGCAPVLIAGYFIIARSYPPHLFATLASLLLGLGMMGDLLSSLPLAWALERFGWRGTLAVMAGWTAVVGVGLWFVLPDPPPAPRAQGQGTVREMLRPGPIWGVFAGLFVGYAPVAALRGLWIGPYLESIHGLTHAGIGGVTTLMGLALICGTFAIGPLDRRFGTRKWVAVPALALTGAAFAALAAWPGAGLGFDVALIMAIGFFGTSYAVQMAHGRAFVPAHLTGRGVSILNLVSIGAVGIFQLVSSRIFAATIPAGPEAAYGTIFATFAAAILAGLIAYLFTPDRTD